MKINVPPWTRNFKSVSNVVAFITQNFSQTIRRSFFATGFTFYVPSLCTLNAPHWLTRRIQLMKFKVSVITCKTGSIWFLTNHSSIIPCTPNAGILFLSITCRIMSVSALRKECFESSAWRDSINWNNENEFLKSARKGTDVNGSLLSSRRWEVGQRGIKGDSEGRGKRNGCTKVVSSSTTYFLLAFPLLWFLDKYNELVNSAEFEAPGWIGFSVPSLSLGGPTMERRKGIRVLIQRNGDTLRLTGMATIQPLSLWNRRKSPVEFTFA